MTDDVVSLPVIGQVIRRRWRSLTVFAMVGALLGAGASLLFSPGYETSSTVLLQGPRSGDELVTEAQIARSSIVLDRTAGALGWGISGTELRDSVNAEIVEGNVIEISGRANTPERAQRLTDQVIEEYVAFSTQLLSNPTDASAQLMQERQEALRQQIVTTNKQIAELHRSATGGALTVEAVQARTRLEALRGALDGAVRKLEDAQAVSSRSGMVVMGKAALPSSPAPPTLAQLAGGGAALFFLLGIFGHAAKQRTRRGLSSKKEIAAALGSPVLSGVDVWEGPATDTSRRPGRSYRRAREARRGHAAAAPPVDVRYLRVLARLREKTGSPLRLLLVVTHDDTLAHRAVKHFVLAVGANGEHQTELRIAQIDAARPVIPDFPGAAGALVVVTGGTTTAWELVAIAEACADAGHPVLGAVVAHPATKAKDRHGEPADVGQPQSPVPGEAMAGSA